MKNTLNVAHFHINMVLSMRNMFEEVKIIKSRGALGTGFMFQTGGKPSTWFPPVGLVELYLPSNSALRKINSITRFLMNLNGWLPGGWLAGWLAARLARWLAVGSWLVS